MMAKHTKFPHPDQLTQKAPQKSACKLLQVMNLFKSNNLLRYKYF